GPRLGPAVGPRGDRPPLVARALEEDALHLRVGVRARRLELPLDQVLAPDAAAPRLPELRLEGAERDPAVAARVGPVTDERPRQLEIAAVRGAPLAEVPGRDHGEPRERAVGHRHVDEL